MSVSSEVPRSIVLEQSAKTAISTTREIAVSLATAFIGIVAAVGGAIAFLERTKIAVVFLGARVLLDAPFDRVDTLKVWAVAIGSAGAVAWGLFMAAMAFVVAGIAYVRSR